MLSILIEYVVLSFLVIIVAKKLSYNAEQLEEYTTINPILMGLVLAGLTSLPELVSALTSVHLGNPSLGVSNILGSNIFNIFFLALCNLYFFKKKIFLNSKSEIMKQAIYAIFMYSLFILSFSSQFFRHLTLANINITTLLIIAIYAYTIFNSKTEDKVVEPHPEINLSKIRKNILINTILIVIISILLAHTAEKIVDISGLSSGAVGAIFVGISTSLPEIITCYMLIKVSKYEMAIASIIGSNTFNFFSFTLLDLISNQSIYNIIDPNILIYAIIGLIFTCILYFSNRVKGIYYSIPSLVIILIYVSTSVLSM